MFPNNYFVSNKQSKSSSFLESLLLVVPPLGVKEDESPIEIKYIALYQLQRGTVGLSILLMINH